MNEQTMAAMLKQLRRQQRAIAQRQRVPQFVAATYLERSGNVPARVFQDAAGGRYYTQKISVSLPEENPPAIARRTVGRVGFYDQR